jgi:hypothetical protein
MFDGDLGTSDFLMKNNNNSLKTDPAHHNIAFGDLL